MGRLNPKIPVVVALSIPLLALSALTVYKHAAIATGKEFTLPVTGFDPRDLLSGHYLRYRVDYGVDVCSNTPWEKKKTAGICLQPRYFDYDPAGNCPFYVRGTCNGGRFEAGIEKFFIPEEYAGLLDRAVRDKKGSLVVSVSGNGRVAVKNLLIDGKTWRDYIKSKQAP